MILQHIRQGFLRHDSLDENKYKKQEASRAPCGKFIPVLSNHAIPHEVAPQQSFIPLHVTVMLKVKQLKNYLT